MWKKVLMIFKSIVVKFKTLHTSKFSPFKCSKQPKMIVDILAFGSSSIDYITYVDELPKPGTTTIGMHREQCYGGKAANQCVAAAKLGGKCALVSKLGQDTLGEEYLAYLKTLEINVDFVERVEGQCTGLEEINRADNSENTVIVLPGANQMLKSPDVTRANKVFRRAKVLICHLETEEKAVATALKHFKGVSILNASPLIKQVNVELIKLPTILCVNAAEAAKLTDREKVETLQDAKAAANDLIDQGVKSVIITMGSMGAVHLSSKERDVCTHCPAAPVRFLADTSGATDAFVGSLAYHIAVYPNLCRESHISAANICAAYAVGHRGTQPSFPGPELAHQTLCYNPPEYNVIGDEPPPAATAATSETETAADPKAEEEPKSVEPKAEEEPKSVEPKAEEEPKSVEPKAEEEPKEEKPKEEKADEDQKDVAPIEKKKSIEQENREKQAISS